MGVLLNTQDTACPEQMVAAGIGVITGAGFTVTFTVVCVAVQLPNAAGPTTCNLKAYVAAEAKETTYGPAPVPLTIVTPAGHVQL